jgi:hypothetical protein
LGGQRGPLLLWRLQPDPAGRREDEEDISEVAEEVVGQGAGIDPGPE